MKKFPTLLTRYYEANNYKDQEKFRRRVKNRNIAYVEEEGQIRLLNKIEIARIQGFPDWFCQPFTEKECAKVLGNAWTLPVIEHIFSFLNQFYKF